jgi:hypothetical protein
VEPARRKKERKTQDYKVKHSQDGSTTSREELAGNKISEHKQDLRAIFHKDPMPLRGMKGPTTTTTTKAFLPNNKDIKACSKISKMLTTNFIVHSP